MITTFHRQGDANNSSSSHSIIFTNEKLKTDEYSEFGWNFFTCANKQARANYIACIIRGQAHQSVGLTYNYDVLRMYPKFISKIDNTRREIIDAILKDIMGEFEVDDSAYVDHQSTLYLPLCRNNDTIEQSFAKQFVAYFVNSNFVILGGNDNDDESHPLLDKDTAEQEDFKELWRMLQSGQTRAVFDSKTSEWVIKSYFNGSVMKIKF